MTPAPPRRWLGWQAGIVLATLAVGAAGSTSLPLADHEVYVVQTAQEMRERGDWLVPHFLGRPRLTKPPLSYWIAAALADATDAPRVAAWHGRAVSIAAAAGVVVLTMALGTMLVDPRLATVAGLIAASSVGLFQYAHNARPDMLYAFWCTAALVALARAARTPAAPPAAATYLVWVCFGLATLTKGPQMPGVLLLAAVAAGTQAGWSLRQGLRVLRPLTGLAVFLAIVVPWWWALDRALGERGLAGTQLGGSLLRVSWRHVLDPYYLYRPLVLVLPGAAVALAALVVRRWPAGLASATRVAASFVVVPIVVLTFGPQHRPHYMLPALAPLCVLLAIASRGVGRERLLAVALVLALVVEGVLAASSVGWSAKRFAVAELGRVAARAVPPPAPLLALETTVVASSYYAGRPVRPVRTMSQATAALASAPAGAVALFAERRALRQLPSGVRMDQLGSAPLDGNRELVLVRLVREGQGVDEKKRSSSRSASSLLRP